MKQHERVARWALRADRLTVGAICVEWAVTVGRLRELASKCPEQLAVLDGYHPLPADQRQRQAKLLRDARKSGVCVVTDCFDKGVSDRWRETCAAADKVALIRDRRTASLIAAWPRPLHRYLRTQIEELGGVARRGSAGTAHVFQDQSTSYIIKKLRELDRIRRNRAELRSLLFVENILTE